MNEEEKRYKINKVISYVAEKKEYAAKEKKSFIIGTISLGVLYAGIRGTMEYLGVPMNDDLVFINGILIGVNGISATVGIKSIIQFINSMKKKIRLDGRIKEINEELDLLEEQENNKSRGGR